MPIAKFQMPDGRIGRFEVPDGTTPEQAQAMIQQHIDANGLPEQPTQKPAADKKPPSGVMDALFKIQGGLATEAAKRAQDLPVIGPLLRGGMNLSSGAAQLASHAIGGDQAEFADSQIKGLSDSYKKTPGTWRSVGPIVGEIGATLPMLPAAAPTLLGRVAQGTAAGGLFGAAQPVEKGEFWEEKAKQAGAGAIAGAAGVPVAEGVSKLIRPRNFDKAKQILDERGSLTPGQAIGGWAKRMEESATSMPIVGDSIIAAQQRGIEDFNRVAINRALKPIGRAIGKADDVGYRGVESAHAKISKAYDDLLPKLTVRKDQAFDADLSNLRGMAQNMEQGRAEQFERILKNKVLDKFAPNGGMHPNTMKEVESDLGRLARAGMKSQDLDHQQLGAAVLEVQAALRAMVERNNPMRAPQLKKINEAYANLLRVEGAAGMAGAKEGIFTPNQLESAVRRLDESLRHRKFAHGKSLMQDLATAGDATLARKVPDSGTPGRLLMNAAALGGAAAYSPELLVAGALASGVYSPIMQRMTTNAIMNSTPALRRAAPAFGLLGAPAAQPLLE